MAENAKIVIAYHINESNIADLISEYFTEMGIDKNNIFLAPLPSDEGKISNTEALINNTALSVVNIPVLSSKFLDSQYCQNLLGSFIFNEDALLLPVILPEINGTMIKGFLKDFFRLFKLDSSEDIAYIYDAVRSRIDAPMQSLTSATCVMNSFIEKYIATVNRITSKVSPTLISSNPAFDQLDVTTDDEMIILYYILLNQVVEVDKRTIQNWLLEEEIYDVDIDNAFTLLATIGYARSHEGILKIDIITFRRWSKMTNELLPVLSLCVKNHQILSADIFEDMWQNNELSKTLKLFTGYLIDNAITVLGNRTAAQQQIDDIEAWEIKNGLSPDVSLNYSKCLRIFSDNNLAYPADWSIHGVPRKYNLNTSLVNFLLSSDFPHREEIEMLKH